MKEQVNNPKTEVIGSFPKFNGTLNNLCTSGFVYLNQIKEALTTAKVIKKVKFVMLATISISPIRTKSIEKIVTNKIAI